jgi:hypothetical protein
LGDECCQLVCGLPHIRRDALWWRAGRGRCDAVQFSGAQGVGAGRYRQRPAMAEMASKRECRR